MANITRGSLSKCTKSNQVLSYSPIMCFFGNVGLQQLMHLIVCLSTGIFGFFFNCEVSRAFNIRLVVYINSKQK